MNDNAKKLVPLSQVCTLNMGQSPSSDSYNENKDGLPFFQGNADFGDLYPTERIWCNQPSKIAHKGDILLSVRAPIGALNLAKEECCIGRGLAALSPIPSQCRLMYLYYALKSKVKILEQQGTGSTFKAVGKDKISALQIPLYGLEEQERIISELMSIDKGIDNLHKQLAKLDTLVKSRFVEMFGNPVTNPMGWEKVTLGNLSLKANNGMSRRGNDADGNIVLRLVELQSGMIDYSAPNRIKLTDTEMKRYQLRDKDFLFARVNGNPENVGRCAVFREIAEPVFHNDHIIRYHFDEERINGTFLSILMNSPYGKNKLTPQIKTSAGQYTVSQSGIDVIEIPLPSIALQSQFADFVAQADKSKLVIRKLLEKQELLRAKLMQEYFG